MAHHGRKRRPLQAFALPSTAILRATYITVVGLEAWAKCITTKCSIFVF